MFLLVLLLQYGPVQFGLVTMNSPGLTYRQACTYYPVTCDAARVHQWLKEMRCTSHHIVCLSTTVLHSVVRIFHGTPYTNVAQV